MAIAQSHPTASPAKVHTPGTSLEELWKLLVFAEAVLKRFWWHTKAYSAILGIMVMAVASLIFIGLHHWLFYKPKAMKQSILELSD